MASSANTSRTMHLSLEKKCANLEERFSLKREALDSAEEKLRFAFYDILHFSQKREALDSVEEKFTIYDILHFSHVILL